MRNSHCVSILAILCSPLLLCGAQSPSNATPPQDVPVPPSTTVSGLLQPSLDTVQQTLGGLKLEKWKRGTVREEADANVADIEKDLQATLPPLVTASDQASGSVTKVLPVFRNIDALYDVLLRVVEASRVSAPAEQVTPLQDSLISLGSARRRLAERLQETAIAQEKQISDLKSTVQAQTAAARAVPAPVTATCAPPAPAKKVLKKKTKPAASTPQKPASPAVPVPGKP
jgi:hypothetical protein